MKSIKNINNVLNTLLLKILLFVMELFGHVAEKRA